MLLGLIVPLEKRMIVLNNVEDIVLAAFLVERRSFTLDD